MAKFQHCSMRQSKVRVENVQNTHNLVVRDPILDVILEMLGNLSFTRRNLINFFVKNLTDWTFISNLLYFIIGADCQNALQHGLQLSSTTPSCRKENWARPGCFHCQSGSGGDRNNCGSRNWSTARHKRKKRDICCLYKDKFIFLRYKLNSIDFRASMRIMWLCYSFVFALFKTSVLRVSFTHLSFDLDFFIKRNGSSQCILN